MMAMMMRMRTMRMRMRTCRGLRSEKAEAVMAMVTAIC